MTSLPSSLAPWSQPLKLFPHEIAIALGSLVTRLAALIGPFRTPETEGEGEPDGFNGLVNRGKYDHLIATDWLLAEEAPDEFDRRAAMHEHLFLKTARRVPARGLGSVLLLDAGPDQLGSPRLAHLALAIVLQQRSERAHAAFSLAIPGRRPIPLLNESTVWELLQARTAAQASPAAVEESIAKALEQHDPEEVWLVGGRRLLDGLALPRVSRICIEDVLEPESRQLLITVEAPRRATRRAVLDLPQNNLCARMLRNPFDARAANTDPIHADLQSMLVPAHGDRRLYATAGAGILLSMPVLNAPPRRPPKVRYHRLGSQPIVAANLLGQTTVAVGLEENGLHVFHIGRPNYPRAGSYNVASGFVWPAAAASSLLFPCLRPPQPGGNQSELLVLDAARNLFRLKPSSGGAVAVIEATDVLAIAGIEGVPHYLAVNTSHRRTELTVLGKTQDRMPIAGFAALNAFVAAGTPPFSLIAIQEDAGLWHIAHGFERLLNIRLDHSQTAAGVIQQDAHYEPALITLRDDNHVLALRGATWERRLVECGDRIVHVSGFNSKPLIAYLTSKGDIVVYSLSLNADICRYQSVVV